ncbi:right-handed parallel beta-helix repeat-containing protein [Pedobacter aquatilis]|uniref:right-handed parallel beta-helix repeat-containing protein n=1 Tax=Pedobacter aquatilis TaxID=351343 RepID=UPI002931A0D2|nr:right-handed parallel beta-helix repeat-containing protein [Pedobacter aquatilis]
MRKQLNKPLKVISASKLPMLLLRLLAVVSLLCLFWIGVRAKEYHVAKSGNDSSLGDKAHPFLTISRAASLALAGDTITVHQGIYREMISPENGGTSAKRRILYRAAAGERVEIKGSEIITGWQKKGALWQVLIPNSFFKSYNPYQELIFGDWFFPGRNKVHTGEIYLSGMPLAEVALADKPMSWSCAVKGDSVLLSANFVGVNPNQSTVEINVRPSCFYPAKTGLNYIAIKGFHFSQAATQWAAPTAEQIGIIGTNWSKGWLIEGNTISDSKCVGIALGKDRASGHNVWFANPEIDGAVHYNNMVQKVIQQGWSKATIGSHQVKNNIIFRCGQAGIVGSFGAAFSEITGNDIYDIYTYRNFWGAEIAGIKLHAGIDVLIKSNRIHNSQKGIWLDWMSQGTRLGGNLLYENDFVDLFLEVNHGPYLVDNNFFLSRYNLKDLSEGGAFVHNLFAGLLSRGSDSRRTPYFAPHSTKFIAIKAIQGGDTRFYNNLFIGNKGKSYYSEHYWLKSPDGVDSLAGYGLSIYDSARLAVRAEGNVYYSGAYPLAKEKQPKLYFTRELPYLLKAAQGELSITFYGQAVPNKPVSLISSAQLGKTDNGHAFTNRAGKAFNIDQDYIGNPRTGARNYPGPLNFISKRPVQLWPKTKQNFRTE